MVIDSRLADLLSSQHGLNSEQFEEMKKKNPHLLLQNLKDILEGHFLVPEKSYFPGLIQGNALLAVGKFLNWNSKSDIQWVRNAAVKLMPAQVGLKTGIFGMLLDAKNPVALELFSEYLKKENSLADKSTALDYFPYKLSLLSGANEKDLPYLNYLISERGSKIIKLIKKEFFDWYQQLPLDEQENPMVIERKNEFVQAINRSQLLQQRNIKKVSSVSNVLENEKINKNNENISSVNRSTAREEVSVSNGHQHSLPTENKLDRRLASESVSSNSSVENSDSNSELILIIIFGLLLAVILFYFVIKIKK